MVDKIDVLAVMDRADERLHNTCAVMGENRFVCEDLRKAHAAAAELIAAAEEAARGAYATDLEQSKSRTRLRAAIAAVRGGA